LCDRDELNDNDADDELEFLGSRMSTRPEWLAGDGRQLSPTLPVLNQVREHPRSASTRKPTKGLARPAFSAWEGYCAGRERTTAMSYGRSDSCPYACE
jgi:hypothetical protein